MFLNPSFQNKRLTSGSRTGQQGSSLVIAIFILVVMLLLGVALTRVLSTSSETIAYEVVGARAYQAANIGLQRRLTELFPLNEMFLPTPHPVHITAHGTAPHAV